jgi:NTE family protein
MMDTTDKPKAYIAFQGGGALGMAHLGAWQEVEKQFKIIGVAGTSSGSIVAALCAAGFTPVHAIDLFHQLNWSDYVNQQNFLRLLIKRDAYSDGNRFHNWLREQLGKHSGKPHDVTFAQLNESQKIYLAIIACDLNAPEKPVLFDQKTEANTAVSFAVRASISIPGLFEPMERRDKRQVLVDGGILVNFPVEVLYERAKNESCALIGVRFKKTKKYLESPQLPKALKRTFEIMLERGSNPPEHIVQYPDYIDIEIDAHGFKPLSFNLEKDQKEELLDYGIQSAKLPLLEYQLQVQKDKLKKLEDGLGITESELLDRLESDFRQQLKEARDSWFSNRSSLAVKVGKIALENFPNLEINEDNRKRFYLDVKHYLERIYRSILHQNLDILRETQALQSLSNPEVYIQVLELIKNELPVSINEALRRKIEDRIDFLKGRISTIR